MCPTLSAVRPRWWAPLLALAALWFCAVPREAAAGCSVTVNSASFGALDVLAGGTVDAQALLTFTCSGMVPVVPVTLCPNLDGGSGGGDGLGGRLLTGTPGGTLAFQIYQDASRTVPWGSTSFLAFGATPTITVVPNLAGAASTTRFLYARVTVAPTTPPGAYASTFASQNFFWGLNLLSCAGLTVGTTATPAAFTFSASVAANCGLTVSALGFGTVGLLDHAIVAQNTMDVRCTATTPWSLGLNNGLNGASPTTRKMANGAARVSYMLYQDSGRTTVWGDLAAGASYVLGGTGTGAVQSRPAYGRVPVQTTPAPNTYNDTVIATVTY
jgi:spore coat protein U-like protein